MITTSWTSHSSSLSPTGIFSNPCYVKITSSLRFPPHEVSNPLSLALAGAIRSVSLTSIQLFVAIIVPFTAYGEQLYLHLKILVTIQSASIGSFLTTKSNLLSYLVDFLAPNI